MVAAPSSFILVVGDRRLPLTVERFLANIGPAVLAALATSLLLTDGAATYLTNAAEVSATVAAIVVAWRTRNFIWTFAAGMVVDRHIILDAIYRNAYDTFMGKP